MLSDRFRLPLALLCVAWLCFMGWRYTQVVASRTSWIEQCTADKASCDGRKVFLALVHVVEVRDEGYTVLKVTDEHTVVGDPTGVEPGQVISVIGRFDASSDTIVVEHREHHPLRAWKTRLSALGLVVAGGVVLLSFRVRDRRLEERQWPT